MLPNPNSIKGLFGEDPAQNTVVIQCRHDKQHFFTRAQVKRRAAERSAKVGDGANPEYILYCSEATLDPATSRIDLHDLVFQVGKGLRNKGTLLDNAIPVVSNLNGAYLRGSDFTADEIKQLGYGEGDAIICQKLSEQIRFIGVSLGATTPSSDDESLRKEQITVRVQGSMDIFNNGKSNFVPGDVVLWEVPSKDDIGNFLKRFGWSTSKVPLKIVPLRHAQEKYSLSKSIVNLMDPARRESNKNASEAIRGLLMRKLGVNMIKLLIMPVLCTHKDAARLSTRLVDAYVRALLEVDDFDSLSQQVKDQHYEGVTKEIFNMLRFMLQQCAKSQEFQTITDQTMGSFFAIQEDLRRRTVGTSLQYGRPGERFTVLLGQT